MAGYNNPYVILQFPELGDDVSVLMRNPQLLPPAEITPEDVPMNEHGQPQDPRQAQDAMYKVFARIIVAWRVYDASEAPPLELSEGADPVALYESLNAGHNPQPRLGEINVENIGRMPLRIINRVMEEISRVADPQ